MPFARAMACRAFCTRVRIRYPLVPQQGPQILQLPGRQPDCWKAIFYQQCQNQVGISPIMFLLPRLRRSNLCRITNLAFDSQFFHQVHEPLHRAGGFDPHACGPENSRTLLPSCVRVIFTISPVSVSSIANVCWRVCQSHPIILISEKHLELGVL